MRLHKLRDDQDLCRVIGAQLLFDTLAVTSPFVIAILTLFVVGQRLPQIDPILVQQVGCEPPILIVLEQAGKGPGHVLPEVLEQFLGGIVAGQRARAHDQRRRARDLKPLGRVVRGVAFGLPAVHVLRVQHLAPFFGEPLAPVAVADHARHPVFHVPLLKLRGRVRQYRRFQPLVGCHPRVGRDRVGEWGCGAPGDLGGNGRPCIRSSRWRLDQ